MVEAPAAALRLIAEIDEYLAALEADWDGVAGARRELARVREAGTKGAPAGNPGGPLCGHLDAALDIAAGRGAAALVGRFVRRRPACTGAPTTPTRRSESVPVFPEITDLPG